MLEEASRASRLLAVAAEPAGPEFVQRSLSPLVLVFGLGEQASSPAFWRAYNEVLEGFPRIALERAVKAWQGEGLFFPKPAEIKERAKVHADAIRQASYRAQAALTAPVEESTSKRDERTPESIAAVGKMLNDFMAVVETKTPPKPKFKPTRGPVDDRGVTAEGRALIERMKQA